jgi:hypothetical protein
MMTVPARILRLVVTAAVAVLLSSGIATAGTDLDKLKADGFTLVPADQLKTATIDTTSCGVTHDGTSVCTYYKADGTMSALAAGMFGNTGKWSVNDKGQFCTEWEGPGWTSACGHVYRHADQPMTFSVNEEGAISFTTKEKMKGNPKEL